MVIISKHVKRNYIFNIDLLDFFTKIDFKRVRGIFQSKPFNFSPLVAKDLANLCCNDIGVLPQGASTSPIISNLICRALGGKLSKLAKTKRIRYTQYVDDITFSSNQNIFDEKLMEVLKKIIEGEGFLINYRLNARVHC